MALAPPLTGALTHGNTARGRPFHIFYRTTILSDETNPDRLHDLQADLDGARVYSSEEVRAFVRLYLDGAGRGRLDPILDRCVEAYLTDLDEDGQVRFKGRAKAFTRAYAFLSSILPYTCLLYTSPSPRDATLSRMPSSA